MRTITDPEKYKEWLAEEGRLQMEQVAANNRNRFVTIGGFTTNPGDIASTSGGNTTILSSGATAFAAGPTGSPTFTVTQAGVMTATSGYIGGATNGWAITAGLLTAAGTGIIQTSAAASTGIKIDSTSFRAYNGSVQTAEIATNGSGWFGLTGAKAISWTTAGVATIGGLTANATSLWQGGTGVYQAAATTLYVGQSGISLTNLFSVTTAGALTATSGTIGGCALGATSIGSTTYTSGIAGWNISNTGTAEFANCRVRGELSSMVFKYSELQATAGTFGVFKSASTLSADCTTVEPAATFDLSAKNSDAGGALFATGDILRIRSWQGTAIRDNWMTVNSVANNTTYSTYTCVKVASGSGGGTAATFTAGTAVIDYGPSGVGFITLSTDGTVGASPNLTMATHAGAPWTTYTSMLRLGNLNGSYGVVVDTYGLGIGDPTLAGNYLTYTAAAGLVIKGSISSSYVYGSSLMTKGTYLATTCLAADATLNVGSTADFAASGSASFIDSANDRDVFTYTDKTATTLTGCSGVLAHTVSASNKPLVVPAVKGIYISDAANEMRLWGDDGSGTIKELASIGINSSGADYVIGLFGNLTSSTHVGIYGMSKTKAGVSGRSDASVGISGTSTSGYGVYGYSVNSYAIYSHGTTYLGGNVDILTASYLGLGSAKGRIIFTDAATDTITFSTCDVYYTGDLITNTVPTGTISTMSVAGATHSIVENGTHDFNDFSGMVIVNNHTDGKISIYICGGGTVTRVASTAGVVGSMAYNAGIGGYTFTQDSYAGTADHTFYALKTRATA